MKCARCGMNIGKKFIEKEHRIKQFKGEGYILCLRCYEDIGSVQTIQDLPEGDTRKKDYKPWWEGGEFK